LAKSVLPEQHPRFVGVFNGDKAEGRVITAINQADLIVSLGAVFGSGHATLMEPKLDRTIRVWDGEVRVRHQAPQPAGVTHLVAALAAIRLHDDSDSSASTSPEDEEPPATVVPFGEHVWDGDRDSPPLAVGPSATSVDPTPIPNGLAYDDVFTEIQDPSFLDASMVVVADTFLGIYPAARMRMPDQGCFVSGSIWASIGHSVGAAVGIAAAKEKRPVVICGDGGFQMIAQSLATMVREQQKTIVVLINNGLHGYEQYLLNAAYYRPGSTDRPVPYAVLSSWDYAAFARALGVQLSVTVNSRSTLRGALQDAKAQSRGPAFIYALVRSRSLPQVLV
jgi:indolepyruvate decarboxylase